MDTSNHQFKATYKDNELKSVSVKYKLKTDTGYIWDEKQSVCPFEILEIRRSEDYEGEPTVQIKIHGKLEEIFQ